MPKLKTNISLLLSSIICAAMLFFTAINGMVFDALSLVPTQVAAGEVWRLLTANLVHFGWLHTVMNAAALLLCVLAFFAECSLAKFSLLFLWCCACVGLGIYTVNPEYSPYAGLSGAIHGLIVAGLLLTHSYSIWIRGIALGLVAAKLAQENSAGYEATDLQALLPVAVAVESHLYGALAGLLFASADYLLQRVNRKE